MQPAVAKPAASPLAICGGVAHLQERGGRMTEAVFRALTLSIAVLFTVFFCSIVIPPLLEEPDILGAFKAGFVNPYASGYSTDVILCWVLLAIWVIFEAKRYSIKHGWLCLVLGVVPGVAVGLAVYLVLRQRQFTDRAIPDA